MKLPNNLPGGWEFTEPFTPSELSQGQIWRKCGPSDAIEVLRVMQPGHAEYDGGLRGISVRSTEIGKRRVSWRKDTWFMAGTESQLMKRFEAEGFARAK
ncbi:hypothetical protein [Marinobacter shengliensis]|uniref:hypothetical protein n=1 Tax=Marinobacter shengliensis TaxID=1389223 RepID=UPI001108F690|nr:hypothetical protein [Marinobacter shengliensis]